MDSTMNVTDPGASESGSQTGPRNPPPPSAEAGVRPPRRIYRDPSGPIGGVAGGFAGYFDIDPVITRLLWIVALFSGIGLAAYLVCWLVIPKAKVWPAPGHERPATSSASQSSTTLLSGFAIIGLVALVGSGVNGVGQYLLPAALIGFGVYLLNQRATTAAAEAGATADAEGRRTRDGVAADGVAADGVAADGVEDDPDPPGFAARGESAHGWHEEQRPVVGAGLVTPTVLSVLAIAAGIIGALHAAGVVHVPIVTLAAAGLVIVGAGLVASLWLGRARGLVPTGLALVVVMLGAAALQTWFDGVSSEPGTRARAIAYLMGRGSALASDTFDTSDISRTVGDERYTPLSLAELEPSYALGVGDLVVDLSRIDFSGQTRHVDISLGMGDATVIVPANTAVSVRSHVGVGESIAFGKRHGGLGKNVLDDDPGTGAGQLELQVRVGLGEGEVRRVGL